MGSTTPELPSLLQPVPRGNLRPASQVAEGGAGAVSGGARDIDFIETHVCTRMLQNTAHPRQDGTLMILEIKKHREQARPLAAARPRPGPLGSTSSCQGHRSQVCSQLSRKLPTVSASCPLAVLERPWARGSLGVTAGTRQALTLRLSLSRSQRRGLRLPVQ